MRYGGILIRDVSVSARLGKQVCKAQSKARSLDFYVEHYAALTALFSFYEFSASFTGVKFLVLSNIRGGQLELFHIQFAMFDRKVGSLCLYVAGYIPHVAFADTMYFILKIE